MEKLKPPTIDIRVDLGKFCASCREQKELVPASPHGFTFLVIQSFAMRAADRPFTWTRKHQRFFDYISGEVVLKDSQAFDDGVYIITEELPCLTNP